MSLERAVQRYVEFGLLEGGSCKAIGAAVAGLKSARKSESWEYSISKGNPIKFKDCIDPKDNSLFNPLIMVDKISVNTRNDFPYQEWITVLTPVLDKRVDGYSKIGRYLI